MNKSAIICRNLTKSYVDGDNTVTVFEDLSVEIDAGKLTAIVGSSGSGKSSLLHLLGGLDKPTQGSVFIGETDLASLSVSALAAFRNQNIGFIYQFHHLLMEFTALENVAMPLLIAGVKPAQATEQATDMLERVGLGHRLSHRPSQLSGGERQRVAIARAVVNKPRLVLADEPTGNLDHQTAEQIYTLMNQLNQELGMAFVVVTHDMSLANRLDRQLTLINGQLESA